MNAIFVCFRGLISQRMISLLETTDAARAEISFAAYLGHLHDFILGAAILIITKIFGVPHSTCCHVFFRKQGIGMEHLHPQRTWQTFLDIYKRKKQATVKFWERQQKAAILKTPKHRDTSNLPVLKTCNSSTIPSLPPPNTTIRSLIETARCPCRGLGQGPVVFVTRFHFSMGAAILFLTHNAGGKQISARMIKLIKLSHVIKFCIFIQFHQISSIKIFKEFVYLFIYSTHKLNCWII